MFYGTGSSHLAQSGHPRGLAARPLGQMATLLPPPAPPEVPQVPTQRSAPGNGEGQATPELHSGTLVSYDSSCSRVPYAYGVVGDASGGKHLFARSHLGRGVVAELLY